jgi:single-strand DNA-binding protein
MLNKVILIGRIGKDPEMRYTPNGTAVAAFSIATTENWKDKNTGEKQEKTEWHKIEAWRRLAEICGEWLSKGSLVYVEGKLQTDSWEDREGSKRYTTKITIHELKMLGGKGGRREAAPPEEPGTFPDDDIPF